VGPSGKFWTFLAMSKLTGPWTGSAADASLTTEEVVAVPEVFVDYSLVGHARRFRARVKAPVRRQLQVGDTVVVHGDAVAPAHLACSGSPPTTPRSSSS